MTFHPYKLVLLILMVVLVIRPATAAKVTITPNVAENRWTILTYAVADDAKTFDIDKPLSTWSNYANTGYERAAADELSVLIERMTGAKLGVSTINDRSEIANYPRYIAIGRLAHDLGAVPPKSAFGIDGSVVQISVNKILLSGETPLASYFAMTRLAEMAGCRWYMPGELGEIIPRQNELSFNTGKYEEVPAIWSRYLWLNGGDEMDLGFHRWMLHNRQYGVSVKLAHIWAEVMPSDKYFKDHPEWYAMIRGKRVPRMLCTSNEEMTREFINNYRKIIKDNPSSTWFSLSQDDGTFFCECPSCSALDPGLKDVTMPHIPQITDRLVNFYNKVVTELTKEYPDKYFCFLAYVNSCAPPVKEKLHPHLMPLVAPIFFSRYHAMDAKNSETMQALHTYIEGWSKTSKYIAYYGYGFNLGDCILPYTRERETRYDFPFMAKNGLGCVCIETANAWQNLLPYYYMIARMNLNPNLNADELTNDFYKDFFGPAATDMKAYMDMLDDTYANFGYEIGGQWSANLLFTPDFMKKADKYLSSAEKKAAGNDILQRRIEMWRFAYNNAKLFLRMRQETNNFEFQKASDTADEFYKAQQDMLKYNPYATFKYGYEYWWKPPFKDSLNYCAEKLKGATIIHKFPDEWYAFVDYSGIGEIGKLYSPDFPLTRWTKLKTYSKTIGEQNLTRFRGTIWYRNSFTLDSKSMNKNIHILFAGFDDKITAYINGQKIGTKGGLFSAIEADITKAVHTGENTVVCSVNNDGIAELETGGLMRPVVLYIPAQSNQAASK